MKKKKIKMTKREEKIDDEAYHRGFEDGVKAGEERKLDEIKDMIRSLLPDELLER